MASMVNFIWSWLEKGFNGATTNATKAIWAKTQALFELVMNSIGTICKRFQGNISCSRGSTWREENGTRVKEGNSNFDFRFGIFKDEPSQQGVGARKELKDEVGLERMTKFMGDLEEIVIYDKWNNNQKENGEKLNAFIEDEQTQEMRQALEKRKALEDNPMVNTNLS